MQGVFSRVNVFCRYLSTNQALPSHETLISFLAKCVRRMQQRAISCQAPPLRFNFCKPITALSTHLGVFPCSGAQQWSDSQIETTSFEKDTAKNNVPGADRLALWDKRCWASEQDRVHLADVLFRFTILDISGRSDQCFKRVQFHSIWVHNGPNTAEAFTKLCSSADEFLCVVQMSTRQCLLMLFCR